MYEILDKNISLDETKGYISLCHDESHVNHYIHTNLNHCVKMLDTTYHVPEHKIHKFKNTIKILFFSNQKKLSIDIINCETRNGIIIRNKYNKSYVFDITIMDKIEKVIYINLDHRTDRKEQVELELLKVFPIEKIVRFNAIYEPMKGHLGCSKSHIGALELAIKNNWKNVLIVEDDMIFVKDKFKYGTQILRLLFNKNPDVIVLGAHTVSYNKNTFKLNNCLTTTAYLVFNHYYQTLLSNFKESALMLEKTYQIIPYAIDRYWTNLQEKDNWYIIYPYLCIQNDGYSDTDRTTHIYPKKIWENV